MPTLTIESSGSKSRTFSANVVAMIQAPRASSMDFSASDRRPVYLALSGSESALRAVVANLRTGRRASVGEGTRTTLHVKYPKRNPLRWDIQEIANRRFLATAYEAPLFDLDPGLIDPARVRCLYAPPAWWVADQEDPRQAVATYFAALLDRRTPLPITNDPSFHRLLFAAVEDRLVRPGSSDLAVTPDISCTGFADVALLDVDHDEIADLIRDQTRQYFEENIAIAKEPEDHGTDGITSGRRLLPTSPTIGQQLSLFG